MMRNINDLFSSPNAHVIRGPITVSLSSRQNWFSEAIDSLKRVCYWAFHTIFVTWFLVVFGDQVTKILNNSLFTFLLSKAKQAKTEHMEMKILQSIFSILEISTKNEFTEICNEPSIRWIRVELFICYHCVLADVRAIPQFLPAVCLYSSYLCLSENLLSTKKDALIPPPKALVCFWMIL